MIFQNGRTASLVTALALALPSIVGADSGSKTSSLRSRHNVDPNIMCFANLPNESSWPSSAPPRDLYVSLTDLCARSIAATTVGCLCDDPYDHVECFRELAHPDLYEQFLTLCQRRCDCYPRMQEPSTPSRRPPRPLPSASRVVRPVTSFPPLDVNFWPSGGPFDPIQIIGGGGGGGDSRSGSQQANPVNSPTCKGSCTAASQQCSYGSTGGCKCTAKPIGGPHGSIFHFFGVCAAVHFRPKPGAGKRDVLRPTTEEFGQATPGDEGWGFFDNAGVQVACPCNASYVSHSCCGSSTGVVWEGSSARLGQLKL
ncbi:MAG: hypothetical protein M1817_004644 [Caeruleum heppii]|nr:MAG: hypothetical protein M1817_004644 [Caeruleum heppii]